MTPAARVQAAIEVLDLAIAAAGSRGAPADRIVAEWFRTRRFAGSKDRRAVRDLLFRAIRACGPLPPSGRAAMLRLAQEDSTIAALFDGSAVARKAFGDDVVDHYLNNAQIELGAFNAAVTDWERVRGFERL